MENGDVLILPCQVRYYYIDQQTLVQEAIEEILVSARDENSMLAVDIETTGLDPHLDEIVTIQIGTNLDYQYIFDARRVDCSSLRVVLEQPCWKLGQNIKFDAKFLSVKYGITMRKFFDTFLAEKVLRGGGFSVGVGYSLDAIMLDRLGMELKISSNDFGGDPDLKAKRAKKIMQRSFMSLREHNQLLTPAQLVYASQDVSAQTIFAVAKAQLRELNVEKPNTLYDIEVDSPYVSPEIRARYEKMFPKTLSLWPTAELEFKFLEVVVDMELEGIGFCVDTHDSVMDNIHTDYVKYKTTFLQLMSKITPQKTLLGIASINPDSNSQVLEGLQQLGLSLEDTKSETIETLLLELEPGTHEHDVITSLIGYRKLSKLVASFGKALQDQVHPITKRIHTSVAQVLVTGRISMKEPNLQQIPRGVPWAPTGDKDLDKKIAKERPGLRECFKARPGHQFLIYDYSAQELRVAASISMDQLMIQAFNENKDLHSFSATLMYHEDYDQFAEAVEKGDKEAKDKRTAAKVVSFGSLYGSGASNLSKKLRVSMDDAKEIIQRYWSAYPELAKAMPRYGKLANQYGYSNTVLGRRRYYTNYIDQIRWVQAEPSCKSIDTKVRKLGMKWLVEDGPVTPDNLGYVKKKIISKFQASINRESGNHHIQGTSADMMKLAAVALHRSFKEQDLPAVIVGLVHDEVIVEVKEEFLSSVQALVEDKMKASMLYFCPNVPAEVEGQISPCWVKG
jgi:DNA polymerase-1